MRCQARGDILDRRSARATREHLSVMRDRELAQRLTKINPEPLRYAQE
jgi:hypothetical protein